MEEHTITVLIVAHAGRFRDGLGAVVQSLPSVTEVVYAPDCHIAQEHLASRQNCFVLIDIDSIRESVWLLLERLRNICQRAYFAIIANTRVQLDLALAAGADAVLLKGFATTNLHKVLEQAVGHLVAGVPTAVPVQSRRYGRPASTSARTVL